MDYANTYTIRMYRDLRRWRLRRYWATLAMGVRAYSHVWRATTEVNLETKMRRWIAQDMLRRGRRGIPEVAVYREWEEI